MSPAAKQYIDLYKDNRDSICENSTGVMNAAREQALNTLSTVGIEKSKDFTTTDPVKMLSPDYSLNLHRYEIPLRREQLFTCSVPNLSTELHYLVNEQYVAVSAAQLGFFAGSMQVFASTYPTLAQQYYNRLAEQETSPCSSGESALNTLLAQDGFVLYIPDGEVHEKPIQLISLLRSVEDFMACQRLLIIIGNKAKATLLLCDHSSENSARLLNLQTVEIFVGEDSSFDFYELEENSSNVYRLEQIYMNQKARSNTALGLFSLTVGQTRNRCNITLDGEGARTQLFGMIIADGKQQVDNLTFIDHKYPDCTSNELFKYVLDDEAQGGFIGRILVREGAVKTEAHQTDRNLCLTDKARMMARPELEIYADDVKCSHGATVGQLDANALYYMRTRGIPESEARLLLMFAFMGDVIDLVRLEPLRDRLKQLVEKRFRGELSQCNSCKIKR